LLQENGISICSSGKNEENYNNRSLGSNP
jgi:hypothetical protein